MTEDDDIFEVAKQLPADEQKTYVDEACGGDAARRREILDTLAETQADPPPSPEGTPDSADELPHTTPLGEQAGEMIGRYKLLQKLGEGGFGIVFMAEQREPMVRRVALKVIKQGMDTKQVIARFEAERQALAMMDHPNIAKVLDAGATERGRPYFVMELVRGVPVTAFCDEQKLGLGQRLELFRDICSGVQHAHQKGIIHRDLKPGNILVGLDGDKPVAKIIDFGIAKATQQQLTDKTLFTRFEQFIGTPAYISPEQANLSAVDVDTRSDIYSLGVLLYELLTGKPPFDPKTLASAGMEEMRKMIREKAAPKPSTRLATTGDDEIQTIARLRGTEPRKLGLFIRGDLDWIILKALEKERARRYESANALREDIERFLGDEPITARPPSKAYQIGKLVRRHRGVAASLVAIAIILFAATGVSAWQAVLARSAEAHAKEAESTALAARDVAEEQRKRAEDLLLIVGDTHDRATDLAASMLEMFQGLGEDVSEEQIVEEAGKVVDAFFETSALGGDDEQSRHMESVILNNKGHFARKLGQFDAALRYYEEALAIREKQHRKHPKIALYLHNLAVSCDNLGDLYYYDFPTEAGTARERYETALKYYEKGLAWGENLQGLPDAQTFWLQDLATSQVKIGRTLMKLDERQGAKEAYRDAKTKLGQLVETDPSFNRWRALLGTSCLLLAEAHMTDTEDAEAKQELQQARDLFLSLDEEGSLTPLYEKQLDKLKDHLERLNAE